MFVESDRHVQFPGLFTRQQLAQVLDHFMRKFNIHHEIGSSKTKDNTKVVFIPNDGVHKQATTIVLDGNGNREEMFINIHTPDQVCALVAIEN